MPRPITPGRPPTLGVLAGWQVYEGTLINTYLHRVLRGIRAAAEAQGCNLLLSCGVGPVSLPGSKAPAWPESGDGAIFLPVGPWNTDGLLVVTPLLSESRSQYLQALRRSGHPVVFIGTGESGPTVVADYAHGIRRAYDHLSAHGHRRIAYIAAYMGEPGDHRDKLEGYLAAVRAYGLEPDPRLIADGFHQVEYGRRAIHQILASHADFTAVIASDYMSAIGAIHGLREAGRRVPEDVAVMGVGDSPEARAHEPPLATISNSVPALGYGAVGLLLDYLHGRRRQSETVEIPSTRLVVRESCGCRSTTPEELSIALPATEWQPRLLTPMLSEIILAEAHQFTAEEIVELCQKLVEAFGLNLADPASLQFEAVLNEVLRRTEAVGEEAYIWHAAVTILKQAATSVLREPEAVPAHGRVAELVGQAHLVISEWMRRQASHAQMRQAAIADQEGMMTARLLAALDEEEIRTTLNEFLPRLGIRRAYVVSFSAEDDDPWAWSSLRMRTPGEVKTSERWVGREFPPPQLLPDLAPYSLALLPLGLPSKQLGFVAFEAADLELCGIVTHQLSAALRSTRLYREAMESRRLAEEANQMKSRFLSIVSHELQTPLNLIVGLSEVLLRENEALPASADGGLRQDLHHIHLSAQHLGQLIRDVLDLASAEAGQLRLACEPLDLAETFQAAAAIGAQLARDKQLDWSAQLPAPGSAQVWGDRTRLRQVALNLINNAVKFTAQGSVALDIALQADEVRVSVKDTGPGIPLADQRVIFGEFYRSERTAARGYGGLGLGLAISKRLIELHRGHLGVTSSGEEGSGAIFFFSLPLYRETDELRQNVETSSSLVPQRHPVVLLTQQAEGGAPLSAELRQRGFEVVRLSLEQTLDWLPRLEALSPAALILDEQLANAYGWGLIRELKQRTALQEVPILFYSLAAVDDAGMMIELDYAPKPLSAERIVQALAYHATAAPEATTVILIVDDEPGFLDLHARMIRAHAPEYRVLTARNGREALAVMQQTKPHLVLLDLMMPEMDGFGVLEAMRERESLRDVPVIVLTAQRLTEADLERLNRGVATILQKGLFSADETFVRLAAALERTPRLSSTARRLVRQAMVYLQAHSAEPLTREQLARHVGTGEDYLTHCFQQELGMSPMTYLSRYRIKQARALLETTPHSITEIAFAVGFSDSAYFSRVFQREAGVSPSAYRRGERSARKAGVPKP